MKKYRTPVKYHIENNQIIFDEVIRVLAGETIEIKSYLDADGILRCYGVWATNKTQIVKEWFTYHIALILLKPIRFFGINTEHTIKLAMIVWRYDYPGKSTNPDDWRGIQNGEF